MCSLAGNPYDRGGKQWPGKYVTAPRVRLHDVNKNYIAAVYGILGALVIRLIYIYATAD